MMEIRRSLDRGHADHGWLSSFHSFSFADYDDREHTHFGALRVINEDRIRPGTGFGTHGHRDMEIVSYVLEGTLAHRDSMGNSSIIEPGDVQRMSAGRGVTHSEFNPSGQLGAHFLQIWILPRSTGGAPSYEQKHFPAKVRRGRMVLVASQAGDDGSVSIDQDARIYAGLFDGDERYEQILSAGRRAYVHVARGSVSVNGNPLLAGDALKALDPRHLLIENGDGAEILLFDLA